MSTPDPRTPTTCKDVTIDGVRYVPLTVPEVKINGVRYMPVAAHAKVIIDGVAYVPYPSDPQVTIDGAQYVPSDRWRPIETAPRAGKWILLWWPAVKDLPFVGYYGYTDWRAATGEFWDNQPGPTHWMPLPNGCCS